VTVVGVVAFLWILVWLFGPEAKVVKPEARLPISLAGLKSKPLPEKKQAVEEPVPASWGRDPFARLYKVVDQESASGQEKVGPPPETQRKGEGPRYEVSTILITESSRLAVINDKVYAIGDQIGGERISSITLDQVVLSDGSEERMLRVPQPQTKVTVESAEGK